jgi:hypothetical protein
VLTKFERRVLYLLRKNGGAATRAQLSQGMARHSAEIRTTAIDSCETLGLIGSAKVPPMRDGVKARGGRYMTRYWLTGAGASEVTALIHSGEMLDPSDERRGCKGAAHEHA